MFDGREYSLGERMEGVGGEENCSERVDGGFGWCVDGRGDGVERGREGLELWWGRGVSGVMVVRSISLSFIGFLRCAVVVVVATIVSTSGRIATTKKSLRR